MLQFNFKDKYYSASGADLLRTMNYVYFFSPLYIGGDGSRLAPYRSNSYYAPRGTTGLQATSALIFSGGVHKGTFDLDSTVSSFRHFTGNGMGITMLDLSVSQKAPISGGNSATAYFRDLTISKLSHIIQGYTGIQNYVYFYNCEILSAPIFTTTGVLYNYISRSKIKELLSGGTITYQNNNSFIGISTTIGSIAGNLHTWEKCNLIINQASLDSYKNNYYAFDNCNFRIGTETEYTPLTGTTPDELRTDFVARCTAAGLTVPADITDYGITLTLGRWIFTKNQMFEGITWYGSEINLFETPRFISFGYSTGRGTRIPVTISSNVPASFAPANPHSNGLNIAADSLSIAPEIDITQRHKLYIDSKIIWLGGKKRLTNIDVPNNMPQLYGVLIDSLPNLLNDTGQEVSQIEPGEMYMVRSLDENAASVTYNGSTYSSALSTRNNIFKGVADVTSFVIASGRAVVYKINDILNYQSIQLRIVNKIPSEQKKTGNLTPNYWYLVEHDSDQNNTTDYITYNGVNYKVGDSFVCQTGSLTFTTTGSIHLRRCWDKDFNFDTEVTDKAFWTNEQKPEWCDVLPEDTRCLMQNNHPLSIEMMRGEDGKYITTGHPEYYNRILGTSGVQSPDDIFISGTYMQIRLQITTVNPM
ncbi:MAG: hypothetical protein LBQ74_03955 [Prevotella sp.]|jgi:hypothetical protein|nr:hypothetical protein [Prevotella sp.]